MPHAMRLLRPVRRRRPGHFFAARQQRTTGPDPLVLLEERWPPGANSEDERGTSQWPETGDRQNPWLPW
jgi:hypothetical protein